MTEISQLSAALGVLRQHVHKELPLQHITLLLTVSEHPGITMPELMKLLEMPQGSLSRNVKALSRYVVRENNVAVMRGYDLLRTERDPGQGRILSVYLTRRGEALIKTLAVKLRPQQTDELPADFHPTMALAPALSDKVAMAW